MRSAWLAVALLAPSTVTADSRVTTELTFSGGSWQADGWGPGTPVVRIAGQVIWGTKTVTRKLPISDRLVEAEVTTQGKDAHNHTVTIWVDLQPGHRYFLQPGEFELSYSDFDDGVMTGRRCGTAKSCPDGLVKVDDAFRNDCGDDAVTCAPPALLRARDRDLTIALADEEPAALGTSYQPLDGTDIPQHLVVQRAGKVVWDAYVILHNGIRYTLVAGKTGPAYILVDR